MRRQTTPPDVLPPRTRMGWWPVEGVADVPPARAAAVALCLRVPPVTHPAGSPALADAAERLGVIFTELVSNALLHARRPAVATLLCSDLAWLLLVDDASPDLPPLLLEAGPHDRHGRGIALTVSLASGCGWYAGEGVKTVWAEIEDLPSAELLARLTR